MDKVKSIKKIFTYIKPYKKRLLFIILSFFISQTLSLCIPGLMANIVDIGIRQNGMENICLDVMGCKSYDVLKEFMSEEEKKFLDENYIFLQKKDSNEIQKYKEKYHLGSKINLDDLYFLKNKSNTNLNQLNSIFFAVFLRLINFLNKETSTVYIDFDKIYSLVLEKKDSNFINKKDDFEKIENDDKLEKQIMFFIKKEIYKNLGIDVFEIQRKYITKTGFLMIITAFLVLVVSLFTNFLLCKMSSGIVKDIRNDIFEKVEKMQQAKIDKMEISSLITRTTSDVNSVKNTIITLSTVFIPPIILVVGVIFAINKSRELSWLMVLGAMVSTFVVWLVLLLILPKMERMQKILDEFNLIIRERLSGIMISSCFGNLEFEEKRFDKCNKELSDISFYINTLTVRVSPIMVVTMNLIGVLTMLFGADLVMKSKIQIGDLMAFLQYCSMVIGAFTMMIMTFFSLPHAFISIDRIIEILEFKNNENYQNDKKESEFLKGSKIEEIIFKDVNFKYSNGENFSLKNINFQIKKGQIVSIVGPAGSGKSTIINLITKFYDVTNGQITINGFDIKKITKEELRNQIGYVLQKNMIFSGNFKDNICFENENIKDDEILKYIDMVKLNDLIKSKKDLEKKICKEGKNLSGGQRQKLCIARILTKNTPVIILDDSFSSMDFSNECEIMKNIFKRKEELLIIIVSQRISSVKYSDNVIVLDEGEILGQGTHEELMKNCKYYHDMAQYQLGKEKI